jgi:PAS domain S-box-containing protein
MSAPPKLFRHLPVSKKLLLILWVFILVVVCLITLSYETIESLSAARAYVGGEGLWSKAQKQAVHDLLRYSVSHSELDYQSYERALLTPLGDHRARVELEKPTPDMKAVYEGFIQGRNDPDDVRGMARLFRRFRRSRYMSEAVDTWAEGDALIERLRQLGNRLHSEVASGKPDPAEITDIARQIDLVGDELTPLEDRFSYALGGAARQAKDLFLLVTFGAASMSLIMGVFFTFFMMRHIRQTEQRYKQLVDTANDAILVLQAETGIIIEANEKSGALLGLPVEQIVGMRGERICADSHREEYRQVLNRTTAGTNIAGKELHLHHSDGHSIAVEVNTSLTEVEGERIIQGIFRDITSRKQLEEEVRQAQKMEVVGRLAGGIAHDFNNLLMVILTQIKKIKTNTNHARILEYSDTMKIAAERAASLTKQLLEFGRKHVLVLEVLDLNELLNDVQPLLSTIPAKQVQLVMTPAARALPVRVDPGKIEQVVMNLAVNACDAMTAGGVLMIKTSRVWKTETEVGKGRSSRPYALLEVIDTGCGMDAETRVHLFEPFFTTKTVGKGTGLGLSTVYGIVTQSGGSIEVESTPDEGTTFRVYLPVAQETIAPRRAPRVVNSMDGAETVLLAEDQPSIRRVLREHLEFKGYKVFEARNGQEAVEIAQRYEGYIDVLVTDVIMPRVRGSELARQVSRVHPGVTVILMSGYSVEALLERGLVSEANANLIQKPFDPEELAVLIRESLDARKCKAS